MIWTIGHSTLEMDQFIDRLRSHGIEYLADVRSFPGSRRFPWFNSESMARTLPTFDIAYGHFPGLGGRRPAKTVTPDLHDAVSGWTNMSFRSYAAWTLGDEFNRSLNELLDVADTCRVAFMCSEAVPWRCHRSILASVITARGWNVYHIADRSTASLHRIDAWGPRTVNRHGSLTWPGQLQLEGITA